MKEIEGITIVSIRDYMENRKFYHLWDLMKWIEKFIPTQNVLCTTVYCLILWIFHEWIFFSFSWVHLKTLCCLRNWTYHNTDHWYHKDINWKKNGFFKLFIFGCVKENGDQFLVFFSLRRNSWIVMYGWSGPSIAYSAC